MDDLAELQAQHQRNHGPCGCLGPATCSSARYLAIIERLAGELATLRAGLRAIEWRKERTLAGTFNEFCPVCHGSPSHMEHNPHTRPTNGHRPKCELWSLLAAGS